MKVFLAAAMLTLSGCASRGALTKAEDARERDTQTANMNFRLLAQTASEANTRMTLLETSDFETRRRLAALLDRFEAMEAHTCRRNPKTRTCQ